MVDSVDLATRSRIMAKIHSTDTSPELSLRKQLFGMGFRYRLHGQNLPGKPDLVFPKYHAVMFVHGCFWHWHGCRSHIPETNKKYWKEKIEKNQSRDKEAQSKLISAGWRVLIVWECSLMYKNSLEAAKLAADWLQGGASLSIIEPKEKSRKSSDLIVVDADC